MFKAIKSAIVKFFNDIWAVFEPADFKTEDIFDGDYVADMFHYKNKRSLSAVVSQGRFPKPDFYISVRGDGIKSSFWKKSTLEKERERRKKPVEILFSDAKSTAEIAKMMNFKNSRKVRDMVARKQFPKPDFYHADCGVGGKKAYWKDSTLKQLGITSQLFDDHGNAIH